MKMKNKDINPYDLEQVGRIKRKMRRRRFTQKDPYDLSSRVYEKEKEEEKQM